MLECACAWVERLQQWTLANLRIYRVCLDRGEMSQIAATLERNCTLRLVYCITFTLSLLLLSLPTALSFTPPVGWGCAPCNQSSCPPVACDENLQYMDSCGCCALCAKEEGERCGGREDVAGRCKPGLYCAYRLGSIFGESRMGICENERCQRQSCDYRQRCQVVFPEDGGVRKLCQCTHINCTNKLNPLCGRDGRKYTSVCELQKKECQLGQPIGILHFNECRTVETTVPVAYLHRKTNSMAPPMVDPRLETHVVPSLYQSTARCLHEVEWYDPFDVVPPTPYHPCTYHVCLDYGWMEQNPVLGCEGNPTEVDWEVDDIAHVAQWSEWSQYSECLGNCSHGGLQNRTRTCDYPPSYALELAPSGVLCEGSNIHERLCEPAHCDICNYTQWSTWSECSKTCNTGVRTRYRESHSPPTVPELCNHYSETTGCRLISCSGSCGAAMSEPFHIINDETKCRSNFRERMWLCTGNCPSERCCRGLYPNNPPLYFGVFWEIECPSNPGAPFIERFIPPRSCYCGDCENLNTLEPWLVRPDWDVNSTVPWFMVPPWRILF